MQFSQSNSGILTDTNQFTFLSRNNADRTQKKQKAIEVTTFNPRKQNSSARQVTNFDNKILFTKSM